MSTATQLISLGISLIAIFAAVVIPDWERVREWCAHLWDEERYIVAQDQAEYADAALEMDMMHEAGHPHDVERYDITRPMPLPEPWDVVPAELRGVCYRDDEIVND